MTLFKILWFCVLMVCHIGWTAILYVPKDYPTIQGAIDAAQVGDTVLVAPGKYRGEITLRNGVTLQGFGDVTQISETLKLEAVEEVTLSSLQVKGTGQDSHFGIFCLNATARIHDVTVSAFHHGISAESSRLTVRKTKVSESFNVGILISQNTEATIEESEMIDNATGIIIGNTWRAVTLRRNRIERNQTGIDCHDANPRLRENTLIGNFVGVQVDNALPDLGTEADPGKNVFLNNKQAAIQYAGRQPMLALLNWWGQATGPLVGQVVGQVLVKPWLRTDPRDALAVQRRSVMNRTPAVWGALKRNES